MNESWCLIRVRALALRFLFAAIAFAAFPGLSLANFEAKISPNQLEAGKPIEITITTQNLGLPEGATIDYSVMGIGRPGGMPMTFESTTAQTRPPGYPPVKVAFTIPADFHAGMAMLAVHGLVKDASGAEIGPKDFQLNVVMVGGEAAAPAGPCTATVEPASIELTRDNKPKEVSVQPSANCTESEIRESFAMLGHGINADLCNIKVQKQPDGNYSVGKFTVRANPNADAPPEGIDWPIGLLGPAPGYKHLGEDPKVNIKLAGAAAPAQPAEPAVLPVNLPAGTRLLKNRQYGTCLTAQTGRADGSALVLAACGSNVDLQTFSFGPHGEIHNGGKCAVLNSNSTEDNTPVVLWTCNNGGQNNEMWTLDGSSRLIGREFKKCLEPNGSDGDNHAAILRPCWNENNQKWDAPVPPPPPVVPVKLPRTFPGSSGMLKNAELGTCLTAENNGKNDGTRLVMADCGSQRDAQIFSFGPNGEVQNSGKCAVLSANSTEDNTPIILWTCSNGGQSNEIWTINEAHQLIGRDHQKCVEPNSSDGAHAAILRPCWNENNQKWNVEQPAAEPQAAGVPFKVTLTPAELTIKTLNSNSTGVKVSANYDKPWDAPKGERLQVTVSIEGDSIRFPDVTDSHASIRPSDDVFFHIAGVNFGESTVHFTFTSPSTGITQTADLKVKVSSGVVKGSWNDPPFVETVELDDPDQAPPPSSFQEPPQPPAGAVSIVGTDAFPTSLAMAMADSDAVENLAYAAAATRGIVDDDIVDDQIAYSQAYDALLSDLRNSGPLVFDAGEDDDARNLLRPNDDQILASMIEGAGQRRIKFPQPMFNVATIGLFPSLQGYDPETKEMYNDIKSGQVNWKDLVRQREPIEILVDEIRMANLSRNVQTYTVIIDEAIKDMNTRIEKYGVDKLPLPALKLIIKGLGVTSTWLSCMSVLGKIDLALAPSKVSTIYANVADYNRVKGAPRPKVMVGSKSSVKMYMVASNAGDTFPRPSEIVEAIAKPLWDRYSKGKQKANQKKSNPGRKPGARTGDEEPAGSPTSSRKPQDSTSKESSPEFFSKDALRDYIFEQIKARLASIPRLNAWFEKVNAPLKIVGRNVGKPVQVISERIGGLNVDKAHSNSEALIGLTEGEPNHFYITGKVPTNPGEDAGYFFGLKSWLSQELGPALDGKPLHRRGVVEVIPKPPKTCSLGTVGGRCYLEDDKNTDMATGYAGSGEITPACECVRIRGRN